MRQQLIRLLGGAGPLALGVTASGASKAVPSLHLLWLSTSSSLRMPNIVVPSLGESMKDGTLATVLKRAGDKVVVDEVVAQIETDKVTIDIKSPVSGVVASVAHKVGDVVAPGAVVAVVGDSAGTPAAPPPASTSAPAAAAAAPAASGSGRTPSISFPARRTSDGSRISDLPAGAHTPAASTPAPAAPPAATVGRGVTSGSPASKVAPAPPKFAGRASTRAGPPRRQLTPKEVDMINLGGSA